MRARRAAGHHDPAEAVARSITAPNWQVVGLAQVTGSLAAAGHHDQAEAVARSITDPYWQAVALTQVAGRLAAAGRLKLGTAGGQAATLGAVTTPDTAGATQGPLTSPSPVTDGAAPPVNGDAPDPVSGAEPSGEPPVMR